LSNNFEKFERGSSYFTLDVYDKLFSGFVKSDSDFEILMGCFNFPPFSLFDMEKIIFDILEIWQLDIKKLKNDK
jgi:hypothetical protein